MLFLITQLSLTIKKSGNLLAKYVFSLYSTPFLWNFIFLIQFFIPNFNLPSKILVSLCDIPNSLATPHTINYPGSEGVQGDYILKLSCSCFATLAPVEIS